MGFDDADPQDRLTLQQGPQSILRPPHPQSPELRTRRTQLLLLQDELVQPRQLLPLKLCELRAFAKEDLQADASFWNRGCAEFKRSRCGPGNIFF